MHPEIMTVILHLEQWLNKQQLLRKWEAQQIRMCLNGGTLCMKDEFKILTLFMVVKNLKCD